MVACGGLFRDIYVDFLGVLVEPVGFNSAFFTEILGALQATQHAHHLQYTNLWLKSDFVPAVLVFKNQALVPWSLRNWWSNCLGYARNMNLIVFHIYREDNAYMDSLSNVGFTFIEKTVLTRILFPMLVFLFIAFIISLSYLFLLEITL